MLSHSVYFTLKESTAANREALVAACKKFLIGHPGTVFFAAGTVESSLYRPVNVLDYDVALVVVFDSLASHDAYQVAPRHLQFVEENKPNWAQVRVFDANVESK